MRINEKQAFAERLKLALTRCPKPIESSADLAVQFNLRHPGASVTQQAVHKWLTGKTHPTPDKIATLAAWLGVSAHWLRYGGPDAGAVVAVRVRDEDRTGASYLQAARDTEEAMLLLAIRRLRPHQRRLIAELVNQLLLERDSRGSG